MHGAANVGAVLGRRDGAGERQMAGGAGAERKSRFLGAEEGGGRRSSTTKTVKNKLRGHAGKVRTW